MPESTSTQSRDYNCCMIHPHTKNVLAGININPVAGLQLINEQNPQMRTEPESTSTQSRDYNIYWIIGGYLVASPESTSTQSRDYN